MFGYASFGEFLSTLFKSVDNLWLYKYVLPFLLLINSFFEWVFISTGGIYFLMVVYIIDFFTGIIKAIHNSIQVRKLKKSEQEVPKELEADKLQSKKFPRFLMTMFAAVVMLVIMKLGASFTIVFVPLYSIFYSVFLTQQVISIAENFHAVGLLEAGILKKIKTKLSDADFSFFSTKK
jgi:hypothetical protein